MVLINGDLDLSLSDNETDIDSNNGLIMNLIMNLMNNLLKIKTVF